MYEFITTTCVAHPAFTSPSEHERGRYLWDRTKPVYRKSSGRVGGAGLNIIFKIIQKNVVVVSIILLNFNIVINYYVG